MIERIVKAVAVVVATIVPCCVQAQAPKPVPATAPAEPNAIPLYTDSSASAATEQWFTFGGVELGVRNVTRPTLTPFLPTRDKATGAAVIVAPGGAFMLLALEYEGWNVAKALADHGIAAFVLKYRLNETPVDWKVFDQFAAARMGEVMRLVPEGRMPDFKEPRATEDALAALRLVRSRAAEWGVDPARVGMMGFSAGAMTTLAAALSADATARPAFIAPIYGPMLAVTVPGDAPPMFAAFALDDELFAHQGFGLVDSWHKAGRPVELHAYERSGHGFALGKPGTTSTLLLDEFVAWLQSRSIINSSNR